MQRENLEFKFCSHLAFEDFYLRTEKAVFGQKCIYKHIKTNRNKEGFTSFSKIGTTYSEAMDHPDLVQEQAQQLITQWQNLNLI